MEDGLAVMLLMLHSARLPKPQSEQKALKVFRESGRYGSFFPEGDDLTTARALTDSVPNLETHDLVSGEAGAVVQSLGNTLRMVRPLIVLDQGHTAYSIDRRRLMGEFSRRVDYAGDGLEADGSGLSVTLRNQIDRLDLARRLLGVVPNPWVAVGLVDQALDALRARNVDDSTIARGRLDLVSDMRVELLRKTDAAARAIFDRKLAAGTIAFRLRGERLDWEMPPTLEVLFQPGTDKWMTDANSDRLGRTLFLNGIKEGELNGFEQDVALYLDGKDAVA